MSQAYCGFLNIRKPVGLTAHDVVAKVRRLTKVKQVGHGGTLDPLAEGVLPVAVGKACRLLRFLDGRKVYRAEILLGRQTTTDDLEGEAIRQSDDLPPASVISESLPEFVGQLLQVPPLYSAVHVGGKRLYQMAREGKTPDEIPVRSVFVERIEELAYEPPVLTVRIACGAGTYIRSIARDLGDKLGVGGCLQALLREQAGPFRIEHSIDIDELEQAVREDRLKSILTSPPDALTLPSVSVDSERAGRLIHGQSMELTTDEVQLNGEHVVVLNDNKIVAICRVSSASTAGSVRIQPEVVLADGHQTN